MPNEQTNKQFDILSIGSVYLDINSTNFPFVDSLPIENETVGGSYIITPGGSALNFAKVSAFLGLKPVFVGKIGQDVTGQILENSIKQTGITPALIKSPSAQTNLGLNFTNTTGKTIYTSIGNANQSLNPEEAMAQISSYLPQTKYLYIGGFFKQKALIPHYPEIISQAKEVGTQVILDHGRPGNIATPEERTTLMDMMKNIDIYLPNHHELLELWQAEDLNYALSKIRNTTQATIVIKQAELGATGYSTDNQIYSIPAFPVATLSPVGAGDSFNAGLIKAFILDKILPEAIRFANATAALAMSQKTLPTTEQVDQFIGKHALKTQPPTQPNPAA